MPTNVVSETFEGTPAGSNLALPAQELDDSEARLIQDALLDYPGLTRRRGPVSGVVGVPTLPNPGTGLVMTLNPQGQARFGVLQGTSGSGLFSVLTDDNSAVAADLAWPFGLPTNPAVAGQSYSIVDAKPALIGGLMIGVSSDYGASSVNQGLAYWYGGNKPNYTTTVTVTRGSSTVVGSGFTANVVPGMFLFANTDDPYTAAYIGVVLSVLNDTTLTLTKAAPYTGTAKSGTFQSLRGIAPKVTEGRITSDVASTTVTGGLTKFVSQGLGTGSWQLYRASDGAFIGKVASVQSDTALTLAANAAVATADASYIAVRADADFGIINTANINKVGFLNATYADRQWFANLGASYDKTSQVWFSDTSDPEGLDLSVFDGNWFVITSSSTVNEPIRAIAPAYNGLVINKENETFIITGTSPDDFTVRKLEDDGALSGMSVQQYAGGVIWAGREGIHFYDGVQTQNLVEEKLGDYYKNTIRTYDPTKYRMWSMIDRDHYFLFIENLAPTVAIVKGNTSTTPTKYSIVINLRTRAITFHTNVDIRGAITLPASVGKHTWYLVNGKLSGDLSDHAIICDGEALFNQEGIDAVTCTGSAAPGPDWFWESKKFSGGDSLRLKRLKFFLMYGLVQGGDMKIDVVLGLNDVGQTITKTFPQSVYNWTTLRAVTGTWSALSTQFPTWNSVVQSVFVPQRFKFSKKATHFSFRIYQSSPNITRLQMGPFKLGYKIERDGRV